MSILKGPSNRGQGGRLGHSNMDHWEFTEEIKTAARKRRRLEAKNEIACGIKEYEDCDNAIPKNNDDQSAKFFGQLERGASIGS